MEPSRNVIYRLEKNENSLADQKHQFKNKINQRQTSSASVSKQKEQISQTEYHTVTLAASGWALSALCHPVLQEVPPQLPPRTCPSSPAGCRRGSDKANVWSGSFLSALTTLGSWHTLGTIGGGIDYMAGWRMQYILAETQDVCKKPVGRGKKKLIHINFAIDCFTFFRFLF